MADEPIIRIDRVSVPGTDTHIRMACAEWNPGGERGTVLCVHGLTRNGRDFDALAAALAAEGWHVLCPDMPGRGMSDCLSDPMQYNNITYLQLLDQWLEEQGLETVHWVGTSMGGIIGMMMASMQPWRIARLVLNDVGALLPKEGLERIAGYVGKKTRFPTQKAAELHYATVLKSWGNLSEAEHELLTRHFLLQDVDGEWYYAYDPNIANVFEMVKAEGKSFEDIAMWDIWEAIEIPVAIIRGEMSDLLSDMVARKMVQGRANAVLHEAKGVGHAPTLATAEQIGWVSQFLSKK